MSTTVDIEALKKLSVTEQLRVIDALCENIEARDIDLAPGVLAELQRRLAAGRSHPASNLTLAQLRAMNEKSR